MLDDLVCPIKPTGFFSVCAWVSQPCMAGLSKAWAGWRCDAVLCRFDRSATGPTQVWRCSRHLSESLWFGAERPIRHDVVSMSVGRAVSEYANCTRRQPRLYHSVISRQRICDGLYNWERIFRNLVPKSLLVFITKNRTHLSLTWTLTFFPYRSYVLYGCKVLILTVYLKMC